MPFEQFKEFTRTVKSARQNENQNAENSFGAANRAGENNAVEKGGYVEPDGQTSFFGSSSQSLDKYEYPKDDFLGESELETLFKSNDGDDSSNGTLTDNIDLAAPQNERQNADFDDEYYGFKKALDEFNEELKNESAVESARSEYSRFTGEDSEKSAYKPVNGTFAADSSCVGETDCIAEKEKEDKNELAETAGETKQKKQGVETSRYRTEFNEFRYARYMGAVIADMRYVYNAKELAAALNDFEKDKFSVYAVNLRQISQVKSVLDKNARDIAQKNKTSILSRASATAYVKKTGDGGGFSAENGLLKSKPKISRPKICVCIGDENGGTALQLLVKEIRYARRNGADEIDVCVSPEAVLAPDGKTLKNEIKALKRAAGKAMLKIGVNLNALTDLQAETLISAASSLKVSAFVLRGDLAAEKIKRLKSFAPHCKTEITSALKTTSELNEALDSGADRVYTSEFISLAACVKSDLESVELK